MAKTMPPARWGTKGIARHWALAPGGMAEGTFSTCPNWVQCKPLARPAEAASLGEAFALDGAHCLGMGQRGSITLGRVKTGTHAEDW